MDQNKNPIKSYHESWSQNQSGLVEDSRDSGILSFESYLETSLFSPPLHASSWSSPVRNQSIDSGYGHCSFESFNPSVSTSNVSFDGCFVEDDATSVKSNNNPQYYGILSSAVAQGGDIYKNHQNLANVRYSVVKYAYRLKKCWENICVISQMHSRITGRIRTMKNPDELNLVCLFNAFQNLAAQMFEDRISTMLNSALSYYMRSVEAMVSIVNDNDIHQNLPKLFERDLIDFMVILRHEYQKSNTVLEPLKAKFRSEKKISVWGKFLRE